MSEPSDVFNAAGNLIGTFTPAGGDGCGCGWILLIPAIILGIYAPTIVFSPVIMVFMAIGAWEDQRVGICLLWLMGAATIATIEGFLLRALLGRKKQ